MAIGIGGAKLLSATLKGKKRVQMVSAGAPDARSAVRIEPKGEVHYDV